MAVNPKVLKSLKEQFTLAQFKNLTSAIIQEWEEQDIIQEIRESDWYDRPDPNGISVSEALGVMGCITEEDCKVIFNVGE